MITASLHVRYVDSPSSNLKLLFGHAGVGSAAEYIHRTALYKIKNSEITKQ